jgi:GTPase
MVHCGAIRQTASIVHMERDQLRTGDKTIARFRFVKNPEYLREGTRMVFREGRTKAVGVVVKVHPPEKGAEKADK